MLNFKMRRTGRRAQKKRESRLWIQLPIVFALCVGLGWWNNFGQNPAVADEQDTLLSLKEDGGMRMDPSNPILRDGVRAANYQNTRHLLADELPDCAEEEGDPPVYTQEEKDCYTDEELALDFPRDLFCHTPRLGLVILHIFGMFYMFCGLAIICDSYFVPALGVISEMLGLEDDVAGATFMAAGGSAPELATSVLGVFVSKSDIGFGTIVGSAVFNVLFVIAGCAFVAPNVKLTWWPLARDCSYYCTAIIGLVLCVLDQAINWWEAVALLIGYLGYVLVMKFNMKLQTLVVNAVQQAKKPRPAWAVPIIYTVEHWIFQLFIIVVIILNVVTIFVNTFEMDVVNYVCSGIFIAEFLIKIVAYSFFGYASDGLNVFDGVLVILIILDLTLLGSGVIAAARVVRLLRIARFVRLLRVFRYLLKVKTDVATQYYVDDWEDDFVREVTVHLKRKKTLADIRTEGGPRRASASGGAWQRSQDEEAGNEDRQDPNNPECSSSEPNEAAVQPADVADTEGADGDDDEEEDEDPPNPFEWPGEDSCGSKFYFVMMWPLGLLIFLTVPHCKRPMFSHPAFAWLTFFLSVVWIGALSYLMVWWATMVGKTWSIPDPVMGVTILAAGTSVPDLLESLAVAKRGLGDMAVSSSIGSNVFDLLMGLPFPWLLYTAFYRPGKCVPILSDGLTIMVLTLFIMVGLTISTINFEDWRLTKRLGYIMLCLYLLFVAESLILEITN